MPPAIRAFLAAALAASACPARAGEMACWVDRGVLVVAAEIDGVDGDFILDTGTARTQVHADRAEGEGFTTPEFHADVRLGGYRLPDRPILAASLDARTFYFPTPVAGVIGADLLSGFVLDVRYQPCRVALWRPQEAPALDEGVNLAMTVAADGRPLLDAAAGDDAQTAAGLFVLATGLDVAARLADDLAAAPGIAKPVELLPGGVALRPLKSLAFQREIWRDVSTGLVSRADLPPGALGELGPEILARWRWRFDFPQGRATLTPLD